MGNYSAIASRCRVDFFKESGKYYTTEEIEFPPETYDYDPYSAVAVSLKTQLGKRLDGMTAVCLEPYCSHPYPIMIKNWTSFDMSTILHMPKK